MWGTRYGWTYVVAGVQNVVEGVARAVTAVPSSAQTVRRYTSFFIDTFSVGIRVVGRRAVHRACLLGRCFDPVRSRAYFPEPSPGVHARAARRCRGGVQRASAGGREEARRGSAGAGSGSAVDVAPSRSRRATPRAAGA